MPEKQKAKDHDTIDWKKVRAESLRVIGSAVAVGTVFVCGPFWVMSEWSKQQPGVINTAPSASEPRRIPAALATSDIPQVRRTLDLLITCEVTPTGAYDEIQVRVLNALAARGINPQDAIMKINDPVYTKETGNEWMDLGRADIALELLKGTGTRPHVAICLEHKR